MDRRVFLSKSSVLAATAAVSAATIVTSKISFAGEKTGNASHDHDSKDKSLTAAASNCVSKGEACLQHCLDMLTTGNTTMANCSKAVREMLIYCNALSKASVQGSKHLKKLAAITLEACRECESECRKHAQHHEVCRECADSCAENIKQCKSIIA
jgi:Cys-rich four helix bundle protein (predicted Tat secretion target)